MEEPEIVTRERLKRWREICDAKSLQEAFNTIELFAGLLEEECAPEFPLRHSKECCPICQRKAAALRRYRGE